MYKIKTSFQEVTYWNLKDLYWDKYWRKTKSITYFVWTLETSKQYVIKDKNTAMLQIVGSLYP